VVAVSPARDGVALPSRGANLQRGIERVREGYASIGATVDRAIAIRGGLVLSAKSTSFAVLTSTSCSKSVGTDTWSFHLGNVVPLSFSESAF
jgi:hypothetical protein